MRQNRTVAIALLVACMAPTVARAGYVVTKIAESTGYVSIPSINNQGEVAFVDRATGHTGVFKGDGGTLTTISTSGNFTAYGEPAPEPGQFPTINDSGQVAFWVNQSTGPGLGVRSTQIYRGDGGALTTIVTNTTPPFNRPDNTHLFGLAPAIDNTGAVYFKANYPGQASQTGTFGGSGGAITTLQLGTFPAEAQGNPSVSADGHFIAYASSDSGNVNLSHNGVVTTDIFNLPGLPGVQDFAVNNQGVVVGLVYSLGHAVLLQTDASRNTITLATAPNAQRDAVALNNLGQVAFFHTDGTDLGIYTGTDLSTLLIKEGDALDGSSILQLGFGNRGLNDHGQVAFTAKLADGRTGVYVLNGPVSVPEPGSLALLAIGAGGLAFLARRRATRH